MTLNQWQKDWRDNMAWKKGQSGNPNGRPKKGHTLTDQIEKALAVRDIKTGYSNITRNEAIVAVLIKEALGGNIKAIDMIMDRVEGKPIQQTDIDLTGALNVPMVKIVNKKSK